MQLQPSISFIIFCQEKKRKKREREKKEKKPFVCFRKRLSFLLLKESSVTTVVSMHPTKLPDLHGAPFGLNLQGLWM